MKKLLIKSVSLMLIFVILTMTLCSCSGFIAKVRQLLKGSSSPYPEGWTAGGLQVSQYGLYQEYWWIETYDELMVAVKKLRSNGTKVDYSYLLNYEGDLFDVKYCISICTMNTNGIEKYTYGADPFDRYVKSAGIRTFGFFDDVSLDELNYSYIGNYDYFQLRGLAYSNEYYSLTSNDLSFKRGSSHSDSTTTTDNKWYIYKVNDGIRQDLFTFSYETSIDGDNMSQSVTKDVVLAVISSLEFYEQWRWQI